MFHWNSQYFKLVENEKFLKNCKMINPFRSETPPSTPKPTPKAKKKKTKKNNRFEVEDDPPGDPDYESPEEEPPWLMNEDDEVEEDQVRSKMF